MAKNVRKSATGKYVARDAKTGRFTSASHSEVKRTITHTAKTHNSDEKLLPLSPKLEKMLEDSWNDNKELYRALRYS